MANKDEEIGIDDMSYPDRSIAQESKTKQNRIAANKKGLDTGTKPTGKGAFAADPGTAPEKVTGIEGADVYKNTNLTGEQQKKYGTAIYGDSAGATMPDRFDEDIKALGVGVTDQETGVGTTPFSQTIQSPELQQKQGGIEMAGVNPVGTNSPYGQNQYGNAGQGSDGITVIGQQGNNWWKGDGEDPVTRARKIMKRMPYGQPGDRAKRRSMLEEARSLITISGAEANQQRDKDRLAFDYQQAGIEGENKQRQFGIDDYNADTNRINATRPAAKTSPFKRFDPETVEDEFGAKTVLSRGGVINQETGEITYDNPLVDSFNGAAVPEGAEADAKKVRAGAMSEEDYLSKYGGGA